MTDLSVASEARKQRVYELIEESKLILSKGIEDLIINDNRKVAATCILYSGGNDSTTLAHLFKDVADYAIHVNTGIGIEQTRQFVRETCASWSLPLMEEHPPPGSTYRELVLDQGFPGPGMHFKMYQRLKERGLHSARRKLVKNPYKERVVFLAGRRRSESKRRANIPESERTGSIVWISPLVNWTKEDLNTYRAIFDVPRNPVSDTLHMSGECLCGSFAKPGEIDEIAFWYPEVAQEIHALEEEVRRAGHPEKVCKWGWGGNQAAKASKTGPLCSSCDARFLTDAEAA